MSPQVLVTKLFPPAARPELVPRPRLTEQLRAGLDRKLTLISAPAGFGKTTLVAKLLKNIQGESPTGNQSYQIAWLSLDENDNNDARFLTYFMAALYMRRGREYC